jgi:hypothetical protein
MIDKEGYRANIGIVITNDKKESKYQKYIQNKNPIWKN